MYFFISFFVVQVLVTWLEHMQTHQAIRKVPLPVLNMVSRNALRYGILSGESDFSEKDLFYK